MDAEPPLERVAIRSDASWTGLAAGRVVHVVGCLTDEVFSFLGPATNALARSGLDQAVVMIDELRCRNRVASLHESAELVFAPSLRNPVQQWRAVLQACRQALAGGSLSAVHLHGLLPCLVGAYAVRTAGSPVPIFYSPHGSRSLGKAQGMRALARLVVGLVLRPARRAAIVNLPQETREFDRWKSAELVESPVDEVFLGVSRSEARHPLIVTGGRSQSVRSAELFAQLAVLLSGEDLRISFNWLGSVDPVSCVRLNAAGVGVFDVASDAEYASRLAAGWVYLAMGGTRGFPLFLVQAMAAGLPCVALDCPQHRAVIRDGETGFLCASEPDMIDRLAGLVDSPALRARIGGAARQEARQRFGLSRFGAKLLAAYAQPA
jgi:glycosyltransferase involved in cell wall biosynthesis